MKNSLVGIVTLLALAACGPQEPGAAQNQGGSEDPGAAVTGTLSYRERIALSPEAVVEVSLQDVSRADAKAQVLSEQKILGPGQVPIRFELEYEPEEIDDRMSYAVQARISDRGRLMFINDSHTPVLTRGAGNHVDMVLVRVRSEEASPAPDSAGTELEGMFRYMADAALFRDCRTGKSFPVSMEGAYLEVERAYSTSGVEPGEEVLVRLTGRYLERPSMEGDTKKIKLIVDIFKNIHPKETCAPVTHAELLDTYWKLIELGGEAVTTPEGMREAHVILASADSRTHGHAGCNNFFGQYEVKEADLSFSAMGATMMACEQAMDTEQAFLAALGATARYRISGLFLELFDADDKLLARLEAIYL